jgi:hypothetical protein
MTSALDRLADITRSDIEIVIRPRRGTAMPMQAKAQR